MAYLMNTRSHYDAVASKTARQWKAMLYFWVERNKRSGRAYPDV